VLKITANRKVGGYFMPCFASKLLDFKVLCSFETQFFRSGAIIKIVQSGALRDFFMVLGRKRWFQNRFFPK
jgi:hypothetical protein